MFVSKKKYEKLNEELKRKNNVIAVMTEDIAEMDEDLDESDSKIMELGFQLGVSDARLATLQDAIERIIASETKASNGTTRRIMRELREALDLVEKAEDKENPEQAEFIYEEPQPLGTLADIRRSIQKMPQPITATYQVTKSSDNYVLNDVTYTSFDSSSSAGSCDGGAGGCD